LILAEWSWAGDMTEQQCIPVPSVTLASVTDRDYELLSQWAATTSFVYAGGSRRYISPEDFKRLIEGARDNFLMVRTRDRRTIGAVSWRSGQYRTSFEIGTMIGDTTLWQTGFGLEAVIALFSMLFDSEQAHRIEFICGVFNKPAIQACCSGLIQIEGVMRDYYYLDGAYHDAIIGSILRDEYYSMVRPVETVPRVDIAEARQILQEYLVKNPIVLRKE
jgi:RimJ/RimL family protein N-acetyltransferase